jgi:hypothetical protein
MIHTTATAYVHNFNIVPLYDNSSAVPQVIKVGILPFTGLQGAGLQEDFKILVMKPFAEKEILGTPQFQIAKGTRRINISGSWCDMRLDDLHYADESFHEPLIDTALREGNEEIGLRAHNIKTLFDLGGFTFISASRGTQKLMHMFAADILNRDDFGMFESTTSETRWMTPEEFEHQGRPDHVLILREVVRRFKTYSTERI